MKFSIVIPVYNTEKYVKQTMISILKQTYTNFELIVVDDCSTDGSSEIVKSFDDKRIKIIEKKENGGVSVALNDGMKKVCGKWTIAFGSDDIMHPKALEKKFKFLSKNPDIDVLGSNLKCFGNLTYISKYPELHEEVKAKMLFGPSTPHPGTVIKSSVFEKFNIKYDENLSSAVDYDLWCQMLGKDITFHNLQEVLFYYRKHDKQISTKNFKQQTKNANIVRRRIFNEFFPNIAKKEVESFCKIATNEKIGNKEDLLERVSVLDKILDENKKQNKFKHEILEKIIGKYFLSWNYYIYDNSYKSLKNWLWFSKKSLFKKTNFSTHQQYRQLLRVIKNSFLK